MTAGSPHARMERWLGANADSLQADAYAELVEIWRDTTALIATQPPHHDRGEVEKRARELLAEAERGPQNDYGNVHRRIAHAAIVAALTEAKQQGPGEAGSPSLKQTPAWWVGYSIGHTGRAPYHCIGPDKPPSQYANDSVHWTPLYTAPQVEAKRQTLTEEGLRAMAKERGWYVREGASVPTADGEWRHPFDLTIRSTDLLALIAAAAKGVDHG